MPDDRLEPRIIRAPELAPGQWLNTERPLSREDLRGRVVLLDFWDYTCVNCLRTLPYVAAWSRRYAAHGLVVVGIHAPEFGFARLRTHVERTIAEHDLPYPVVLDNDYQSWERFVVKAWPTKVLIDPDGYIRREWQGEGFYRQVEEAVQLLLRRQQADRPLPPILEPMRDEDKPGAVCYRPTGEVYAGVQTGGLFAGGLGNPAGYATQGPVVYELPPAEEREEGRFYLGGIWRAWPEAVAHAGQMRGDVRLRYRAATVNAVLSPSPDPVDALLNLPPAADPIMEVRQDGRYLSRDVAGADVVIEESGRSVVRVTEPRLYELVRNTAFGTHELALVFRAAGLALYSFSFTGCVAAPGQRSAEETYTTR